MEEFIRFSGKTTEEALMEASISLGTSSDNIEYRVIEKETKGFLGIGAKKALIEARRKVSDEELMNSAGSDSKPSAEKKAERKPVIVPADPVKAEKKAEKKPEKKPERKTEKSASSAEERPEKKTAKEPVKKEAKPEKTEKAEGPARVPADPELARKRAEDFLTKMLSAMGSSATVSTQFEDNVLSVVLDGDDMGVLIGKRGQTLDSIQYLTSLVVNRGKASYVRVKVDTENYRERRRATLENLAKNMAFKVKKTRRPAYLEPMNPYERRIIHSALQNDPYVTTHSEGEEPCRKVVITLKKRSAADMAEAESFENEADE